MDVTCVVLATTVNQLCSDALADDDGDDNEKSVDKIADNLADDDGDYKAECALPVYAYDMLTLPC